MKTLALLGALGATLFAPISAAQEFSLRMVERNALRLETSGRPPVVKHASDPLSEQISGGEDTSCGKSRKSAATAKADILDVAQRADGISFSILTAAATQGGHFRKCVLGSPYKHEDTTAHASARSVADLAITFKDDAASAPYLVEVTMSSEGTPSILKLAGPGGKEIPAGEDGSFAFESEPGAAFVLQVMANSASVNEGECCHHDEASAAVVDVRVRRAPLLAFKHKFQPLIAGGKKTDQYPSVGAIVIDGKMHCTATVVGKQTLLTAAHCLYGFEDQLEDFAFLVGETIWKPSGAPMRIVGFDYPKGLNGEPYKYNVVGKLHEDDIGVAYLEQPTTLPIVRLHQGDPSWNAIHGGATKLVFVGYGYDLVGGELDDDGIKRFALGPINLIENRRVGFYVAGISTCKGDSGGPALLVNGQQTTQVAVTSVGSADCRVGYETRIDAFAPWLQGRIR